ncbi:hypothetical protein Rsub_00378 [Raphidocelis subcapitata]|uniref:Uncharacterized protein n=1 Tax=Raphidocelis subcapitata TaxID=307507 RepID=A0A2V0NRW2_9CHLO|nr:hypothetical protein Rsub_00378 [Raphidocelis subcapitata]|eukprot:GBF87667.1 hypothetical protein Rsub_00378 [Raphidocelis subcapitata]
MASRISEEPVAQLQALERSLGALTARQTAAFGAAALRNAGRKPDGDLPREGSRRWEFAAAVHAVTESLRPGTAPPLAADAPSSSGAGSRSGSGGARPPAAAARALFPPGSGCDAASPEAFYRVREALGAALKALAAAFRGSHPGLSKALRGVVEELEETGLFD